MSYKEKPIIKLYKYEDNSFILQAQIDDYAEASFERNLYSAGVFTITINYNIPNAVLFQRGLFVQFGNDPCDFGEIYSIQDSIGADGKGSQIRTITGYDARYILKRRVIKNMNSNGLWVMTAKGELCLRNLIKDQCGSGAEEKRRLPIINAIPDDANAIGKVYSVSEQFTNLYEVCKTIATQSEIGWRIGFDGEGLTLECYEGADKSQTVRFDTNYESLADGQFSDSSESFSNAIYVGGKGQNDDRDIYEGENGTPSGLDRFESWDNQSSLTVEEEYEAEATSMLTQYGQTIQMNGNGLAKCPYVYKEQYNVGDLITVAFSGKSAVVQILSVTEHWLFGSYDIQFTFGKPQPTQSDQLQLMLRKIQSASNKTNSTDSIRWYTIPTDTEMPKADVTYSTIGFVGTCASGGSTFKLYLDNERTGAKTYHVYFKQLGGGKITLTTGKSGAVSLTLNSGTYVAIIYVDESGNVTSQGMTTTDTISEGNVQPATSSAVKTYVDESASETIGYVNESVQEAKDYADEKISDSIVNSVTEGDMKAVTSNAVALAIKNSGGKLTMDDLFPSFSNYGNGGYVSVSAQGVYKNANIIALVNSSGSMNITAMIINDKLYSQGFYNLADINKDYKGGDCLTGFNNLFFQNGYYFYRKKNDEYSVYYSKNYNGSGGFSSESSIGYGQLSWENVINCFAKNGVFIILTSGGLWSSVGSPTNFVKRISANNIRQICYGNGMFATIVNGYIYKSTDGVNWTNTNKPANFIQYGAKFVCYYNYNSTTQVSTDLQNWTTVLNQYLDYMFSTNIQEYVIMMYSNNMYIYVIDTKTDNVIQLSFVNYSQQTFTINGNSFSKYVYVSPRTPSDNSYGAECKTIVEYNSGYVNVLVPRAYVFGNPYSSDYEYEEES